MTCHVRPGVLNAGPPPPAAAPQQLPCLSAHPCPCLFPLPASRTCCAACCTWTALSHHRNTLSSCRLLQEQLRHLDTFLVCLHTTLPMPCPSLAAGPAAAPGRLPGGCCSHHRLPTARTLQQGARRQQIRLPTLVRPQACWLRGLIRGSLAQTPGMQAACCMDCQRLCTQQCSVLCAASGETLAHTLQPAASSAVLVRLCEQAARCSGTVSAPPS